MNSRILERNNRVPEHIFRYVENELLLYETYKTSVHELELDLKDSMERSRQISFDSVPNRNGPGDPVNLAVLQTLILEEHMKYLLSRIRKIETGLKTLTPEEKSIVESKYLSRIEYTHDQIIIQLKMNRTRYYKLREGIIHKYAVLFGLL